MQISAPLDGRDKQIRGHLMLPQSLLTQLTGAAQSSSQSYRIQLGGSHKRATKINQQQQQTRFATCVCLPQTPID